MTNTQPDASSRMLRSRTGAHHSKVGFSELFFDLVFVFAVTQTSHFLLHHPTPTGAFEATILLLALWFMWMWTAWVTNWLDVEHTGPRIMLFVLMAAGLVMSAAMPEAFSHRGLWFAGAYVFMHVFRTGFLIWALRNGPRNELRNFQRVLAWLCVSAPLWIAGGLVQHEARWALWIAALAVDALGPWLMFWTPGLGRSTIADWSVDAAHLAERCGLFVIIALGESILVTGATVAEQPWVWPSWLAFGSGLVMVIGMWWVYFGVTAEEAAQTFEAEADRGSLARSAYTYAHIPIIAGIIVSAVSSEMILAHPLGAISMAATIATLSGPGLFLVGVGAFCRLVTREFPLSPSIALVALLCLFALAPHVAPVTLSLCATIIMIAVAVWEAISLKRAAG